MARFTTTTPGVVEDLGGSTSSTDATDAHLLHLFCSSSSEVAEAAFASLVDRYGPIVYRVCSSVIGDAHEAQDAAQSVFLVLARKARGIRKPESLGPWLHGVAVRVARRARRVLGRRLEVERRKAEMIHELDHAKAGAGVTDYWDLHEEIAHLPEKYRLPVVLCYVHGRTQIEAAQTLGWPLGTVQARLHRARERLRSRLSERGVGLAGLTSPGLAAPWGLPPEALGREWTDATARAAVRFAAGKGTAGIVAPSVAELAETMARVMLGETLTLAALVALSIVAVCWGSHWALLQTAGRGPDVAPDGPRPVAKVVSVPAAAAKPERPATLNFGNATAQATSPTATSVTAAPADNPAGPAPRVTTLETPSRPSPGATVGLIALDREPDTIPTTGLELFERVWVQGDRRGHGGDGLGPVFNAQSCAACHHLGGTGGAGTIDANIEIATIAAPAGDFANYSYSFRMDFGTGTFEYRLGGEPTGSELPRISPANRAALARIHPGFRDATSVVLHRFGTDPDYQAWRASVPGRHEGAAIQVSERNPPALFGAGLIDAIPDQVIETAARRKSAGSFPVTGRVSRLKDRRIGRFGWKAQTATLSEFVRSAAAGEIGLEIPGRHQAINPRMPGVAPTGTDMDESECKMLVEYVRGLARPVATESADPRLAAQVKAGETTFKSIGCAGCHLPRLGDVDGIYSDLLLHDMGPRLADANAYAVFAGDPPGPGPAGAPAGVRDREDTMSASTREWRTPPLWGVRDSAPYLQQPCRRAPTGDHDARRRGRTRGAPVRRAFHPPQAAGRGVSVVARISQPGSMKGAVSLDRAMSTIRGHHSASRAPTGSLAVCTRAQRRWCDGQGQAIDSERFRVAARALIPYDGVRETVSWT